MSDNRSIQRQPTQRAGAIMTPQGPAVIQVIDIPTAAMGLNVGAGNAPIRKVGGINILGAILKRWWLVLIVTVLIGGAFWVYCEPTKRPPPPTSKRFNS